MEKRIVRNHLHEDEKPGAPGIAVDPLDCVLHLDAREWIEQEYADHRTVDLRVVFRHHHDSIHSAYVLAEAGAEVPIDSAGEIAQRLIDELDWFDAQPQDPNADLDDENPRYEMILSARGEIEALAA